jgi:hypothetical protein
MPSGAESRALLWSWSVHFDGRRDTAKSRGDSLNQACRRSRSGAVKLAEWRPDCGGIDAAIGGGGRHGDLAHVTARQATVGTRGPLPNPNDSAAPGRRSG